jgi:hypothetical protein
MTARSHSSRISTGLSTRRARARANTRCYVLDVVLGGALGDEGPSAVGRIVGGARPGRSRTSYSDAGRDRNAPSR